jgi:hypothetical protein
MATEEEKAGLTRTRGQQAAKMSHEEAKKYVAGSAKMDIDYPAVAEETAGVGRKQEMKEVLGSFKQGGTVPATGNYKLHKGEKVIPVEMTPDYSRSSPGAREFDKSLAAAESYKVKSGLTKGYMKHGPNDNMVRAGSGALAEHDKDK